MFYYQCEERSEGGCSKFGACGKGPNVAALQNMVAEGKKSLAAILRYDLSLEE